MKVTVREKHSHVSPTHKEERCDAALLIAAGDLLAAAVTLLRRHQLLIEGNECVACDATEALDNWKRVTG